MNELTKCLRCFCFFLVVLGCGAPGHARDCGVASRFTPRQYARDLARRSAWRVSDTEKNRGGKSVLSYLVYHTRYTAAEGLLVVSVKLLSSLDM